MKGLHSSRQLTVVLSMALAAIVILGMGSGFLVGRNRSEPMSSPEPSNPGLSSSPETPSAEESSTSEEPSKSEQTTDDPPEPDLTVDISAKAAEHPRADEIQAVLQQYFDGINQRDYDAWAQSVDAQQSADRPSDQWVNEYSTTQDSNILIVAIGDNPFRVRVDFTSNQTIEFAPKDLPLTCIDWKLTYRLQDEDGKLVVGNTDTTKTRKTACAAG